MIAGLNRLMLPNPTQLLRRTEVRSAFESRTEGR